MDAMMLSNVRMAKGKSKEGKSLQDSLNEIVYALATTNPTWTFECSESRFSDTLDAVEIFCDGQCLGNLGREYSSRSGGKITKVAIENVRGNTSTIMRSVDNKKVIREVKKNFKPKSIDAIIAHKINEAKDVVSDQRSRKSRSAYENLKEVEPHIQAFAMEQERQKLEDYIRTKAQGNKMVENLRKYDELEAEANAILKIEQAVKTGAMVFIMVKAEKYFVKGLDTVQTYDDNTLPYEYRGKLGMLKLVNDEQCIEGVGCRASDNTFILVMP